MAETAGIRWGMVVDVNRCVGCQTCTIACKHANDTPPGVQWRRVLDVETGVFPDVSRLFLVTGCQHCAEPPCVPVCPTGATKQRADGLVTQDYDICIGCANCAVSCPYQARTIVHDKTWYYGEATEQEIAVAHDDRLGVVQKCTFCVEKIDEAAALGLTPGVDLEVTPACAASCIAQALHFGDFNDPDSNVSGMVARNRNFQMHAELGTDPQIRYLYETPAVPGRDPGPDDTDDDRLRDPENPLAGTLQTVWDWRAAMNWWLGGLASGFAIVAWLFHLFGAVSTADLAWMNLAAAAIMGLGLFFVWLKIGRKFRAWRAIMRPQTSWMTRELYAAAVFFPAVLAGYLWPGELPFAITAVAAAFFLICQAKILHMAKGIPCWRVPLMPWMIVASGLLEGTGLLAVASWWIDGSANIRDTVAIALILLVFVNAPLWRIYRRRAKGWGVPPLSRDVIDRSSDWHDVRGYGLPIVLAGLSIYFGDHGSGWFSGALKISDMYLIVAGALAVQGGQMWKFKVITKAAYQQGFALAKMPQRGSGTRAAPIRTTPAAAGAAPGA